MLDLAHFKLIALFERHFLNPSFLVIADNCWMMVEKWRKISLLLRIDLLETRFEYVHGHPAIKLHSLRNLKSILYRPILRIHRQHSGLDGDVIKLKLILTRHKFLSQPILQILHKLLNFYFSFQIVGFFLVLIKNLQRIADLFESQHHHMLPHLFLQLFHTHLEIHTGNVALGIPRQIYLHFVTDNWPLVCIAYHKSVRNFFL